ncbi:MAG: DUF4912 domain-containing protein [Treponemataceae bacterium]
MEELRLTRSYLETLSTNDLSRLALRFGLDLPGELNRVFVISEILDASSDDESDEVDDQLVEETDAKIVSGLPLGYNETYIGLLLRDPVWAYAFWEIRQTDRETREKNPQFGGYQLRVTALTGPKGSPVGESFSIPVGVADGAWYLCLPGGTGWYRVTLISVIGSTEEPLAHSAAIRVPRGGVALAAVRADGEPPSILTLSGLDELVVLQGGDRESRLPQRCED